MSVAARKCLFFPRSPMVLMLKAALRCSASLSLTPARALTGALSRSASDELSYSLSRKVSRLISTAMSTSVVVDRDDDACAASGDSTTPYPKVHGVHPLPRLPVVVSGGTGRNALNLSIM